MSDDKIAELDKRLAVLAVELVNLQKSVTDMKAGQNRLLFVVAAAVVGSVVNWVMSGRFPT